MKYRIPFMVCVAWLLPLQDLGCTIKVEIFVGFILCKSDLSCALKNFVFMNKQNIVHAINYFVINCFDENF